jgi:hypothetical protein
VNARYLAIYLNDHLAGAMLGVELVRRVQRENEGTPLGDFLRKLGAEIVEDRGTLLRLMDDLGVARSTSKLLGAWAAEKLGRLKLNGQLTGYSPLSRLVELEGLSGGIEGKRLMWVALAQLAERDERLRDFDFPALEERARSQRERLEPHRVAAAADALVRPEP